MRHENKYGTYLEAFGAYKLYGHLEWHSNIGHHVGRGVWVTVLEYSQVYTQKTQNLVSNSNM